MRAYLLVAALLLLIFGGISAYLYRQFATLSAMDFSPPPVAVGAARASRESWSDKLDAVGTIKAARGVALSTEEPGEIIAIPVASGAKVRAGQLLLTLNDKVEQASRERQIANLELAQLLFERDQQLIKQKSIPQTQFDRSKADLDSAVAQLAETEARLENKRIHAPFAGTLGIIRVKVGDYVVPGTVIATLQDLDELEIDFTVQARHYTRLRPGQDILVKAAAYPGQGFHATLESIDSQVDAATRNLLLRARLGRGSGLLPGMFAELKIALDEPRLLVSVPETAVTYSLHGDTVYIIHEEDGQMSVEPRIVTTGSSRDGRIAILEGLDGEERVVTTGQNKLFRGAAVTVDESVKF